MGVFGAAHDCGEGWAEQKGPPPKIFYTYPWQSYALSKEDLKIIITHVTHLVRSANISILSLEISNLLYQERRIYLEFLHVISNSFNFFEFLKFNKYGFNKYFKYVSEIGCSRSS